MKFGLICTRCWNDKKAEVVDNCLLHFLGHDFIMFQCQQCGEEEILAEETVVRFPKQEDLLKEKRKILKELKRKVN